MVLPDGRSLAKQEIVCEREGRSMIHRDKVALTQDLYPADAGFCDALVNALGRRNETPGR
jgi:hypothetical protein